MSHPHPVTGKDLARVEAVQLVRQREAVRVALPDARRLVIRGVHHRKTGGLTGAMPGKRDAGRLAAALRDDSAAPSGMHLPHVRKRQRHEVARIPVIEHVVTLARRAVEKIVARDAVHARLRTRGDARVAGARVRRQIVHLGVAEPRGVLAQTHQGRHDAGMAVEVVRTHAVENQKEDRAWPGRRRPDARQDFAGRCARHRDAQGGSDRHGHVLLHGG